ncbi:MAG: F0F1 ATP synthase subunit A [Clostridia bacterium]|nr:F0F1 ATP synthase subunit A [Clostridia bacterium]
MRQLSKKQKIRSGVLFILIVAALLAGIFLTGSKHGESESIREVMQDAVLHESAKINLFGLKEVNPAVISAFAVTGIFLVFALVVRIFVIPKFKEIPGKFQLLLEQGVGLFDSLAKSNSPHRNKFLGGYVFTAGAYIFVGTLFELFGVQAVTTSGASVSLPAPLADINGAIGMGVFSYLIIMSGAVSEHGIKGIGKALKDFSLPISMSFRLFGALLSGALVTELVYHYLSLSFVLPIFVGVMFTLLHALIQAYVLTMLTALFYGEMSEPAVKKTKKLKKKA